MPRILHIIDSDNFIAYVKATYEINDYINSYQKFEHVILEKLCENFDIIIIHYLKKEYTDLLSGKYFDINKIAWVMWGADAFQLGKFYNIHLMPQTNLKRLKNEFSKGLYKGLLNILRTTLPRIFDQQLRYKQLIRCITSIKNIITLAPGDASLLVKHYGLKARIFHLNYLDPIFINRKFETPIDGDNILLGNSAEYTNNHYDVINKLGSLNLDNRKVIIPVSYGDQINAEFISKFAFQKLDNNAVPLKTFMPFDDYTKLLNSCEISIMPHIRQQGLGNVVKLLLNGSNVYFNKNSNVYKYLNSNGFVVSNIDDLSNLRKLTSAEKETNKILIEKCFGQKITHQKTTQIINEILKG